PARRSSEPPKQSADPGASQCPRGQAPTRRAAHHVTRECAERRTAEPAGCPTRGAPRLRLRAKRRTALHHVRVVVQPNPRSTLVHLPQPECFVQLRLGVHLVLPTDPSEDLRRCPSNAHP